MRTACAGLHHVAVHARDTDEEMAGFIGSVAVNHELIEVEACPEAAGPK